jgi:hypothetical protein
VVAAHPPTGLPESSFLDPLPASIASTKST